MMKISLAALFLSLIFSVSFSQAQHRLSAYLQAQYNKTIYDRTKGNNPWGAGLGLQAFLGGNSKFKPTAELTADIYLEDDKVLRAGFQGGTWERVPGMINLFGGAAYYPAETVYMSFTTGPSFIDGRTILGIKPSFGIHFPKNKRWLGKVSYINAFNRIKDEDFGSVGLSIGLRLF